MNSGSEQNKASIDVFEYIEKAAAVLEEKRDVLNRIAARITTLLEEMYEDVDEMVSVTYRIKTANSLKEKIVRNALYRQFSADRLIYDASDTIGVRLECRFLADEKLLFSRLEKMFSVEGTDGCRSVKGRSIYLKLDTPQPEIQKNGLSIYRIDGYVLSGGEKYNFELQIKSLVNSFWSEIEHKIIYKNKRFMMIDKFVNELMMSIHTNLVNIDSQLHMLFKRCLNTAGIEYKDQVGDTLNLLINEIYSRLVEDKIGFPVNIKNYSEALVKYVLEYSSFTSRAGMKQATMRSISGERYANTVFAVMNRLRRMEFDDFPVGEKIELTPPFKPETDLQRAIAERLLSAINCDFYVNTFFHIFFNLEVGDDRQDFQSYVEYYEWRIARGKTQAQSVLLRTLVEKSEPSAMLLESGIEKLASLKVAD
ncbi:MAG: hypothetical protein HFE48_02040 [Clostridia bacterium]|nr:hypothetical protein [Clostridia bacterium]